MINRETTTTNWLSNLLFIATKFYQFRQLLKNYLINSNSNAVIKQHDLPNNFILAVNRLIDLDLNDLYKQGIRILILDYDGVLTAHGEIEPSSEVIEWLQQAVAMFGSQKIFILSNNPLQSRAEFFTEFFTKKIIFINKEFLSRPKPYPDGVQVVLRDVGVDGTMITKSQVLLVDDRLSSGILAAEICGISGCLVKKPYTNLKKHFILEWWFIFIRKLEKLILWHLW
jgi:predicted HAD superfamily phosphohydrolase YqeG